MWVEVIKSHTLALSREELSNYWNCLEIEWAASLSV